MFDRPVIALFMGLNVLAAASQQVTAISITKYSGSTARTTIKLASAIVVWILAASFGLQEWEPLSIFGFLMIALGTLLFNEFFVISYFGLDQWTKTAIERRKQNRELEAATSRTTITEDMPLTV
jgi:hypothetical protein